MYYDLPTHDSDQIDLPISPHGKFYIKFAPLHPNDDPQIIFKIEHEKLRTLYSVNALPKKEVWFRKRITKIISFGNKVQSKFDLNCMLYRYYISRNKKATLTLTDAHFPSINPIPFSQSLLTSEIAKLITRALELTML